MEASTHDEDALLINIVIERVVKHPGCNAEGTLFGLLRTLIDPENMLRSLNRLERSEFLQFFYKNAMHRLTEPIVLATHGSECLKYISRSENSSLVASVLDVLSFAVENHTYHVKNYILGKEILQKVLLLMNPRYSFLALNALKFFRKIIGLKDEFYNRYIVKFDLMSFVVDAFVKNGQKHNMLNSAVLELMEFIKIEDLKTLIKYVCENHIQDLLDVEQCATFKALHTKHEQIVERERAQKAKDSTKGVGGFDTNNRFRRDPRELDENEENYFKDDDEPTPPATPTAPEINKALYNSPLVVQNRVLDTKPPPNKVITSSPTITSAVTPVITPEKTTSPSLVVTPMVVSNSSPLVDYADDSEDDDEDEDQPLKRQKVSSTVT
eukprot:sb/3465646/